MAKIYDRKIRNGDAHPVTGVAWSIEDVPERWRTETRKLLEGIAENE